MAVVALVGWVKGGRGARSPQAHHTMNGIGGGGDLWKSPLVPVSIRGVAWGCMCMVPVGLQHNPSRQVRAGYEWGHGDIAWWVMGLWVGGMCA